MSVEMLINAAIFTFVISGLLAALLMFNKSLSGLIAGLGGVLANLAMLLAGGQVLLGIANASDFMLAVGNWSLHITALNGLWLVVLVCQEFLSACLISVGIDIMQRSLMGG